MDDEIYFDITSATILSGGGAVRVWHTLNGSTTDLVAQVFDDNFNVINGPFVVESGTGLIGHDPNVIALSDGGFLVVWGDSDGSGSIGVARFDESGNEIWSPATVSSSYFENVQRTSSDPVAVETSDGGIFIIWEATRLVMDGDLLAVQLDENGDRVGITFQINANEENSQSHPAVAALQEGGFVVVWQSAVEGTVAGQNEVFSVVARIYDNDGDPVGGEIIIADRVGGSDATPQVAGLATGGFVVTYDGGTEILARVYSADGVAADDSFVVAEGSHPWVTGLADGTFTISWADDGSNSSFLQRFLQNGASFGNRITLDSRTQGEEFFVETSVTSDGTLFAHWQYDAGGTSVGLFGSIFDFNTTDINAGELVAGTFANDSLVGTVRDDTLVGGSGDDTLVGRADGDILQGGSGQDLAAYNGSDVGVVVNLLSGTGSGGDAEGDQLSSIEHLEGSDFSDHFVGDNLANRFVGNDGADTLNGGRGVDTLDGGVGNDILIGGPQEDLLIGGDGADDLNGGSGNDVLQGGAGSDTLFGSTGDDSLNGGAQADRLIASSGADTLNGAGGSDRVTYVFDNSGVVVDLETGLVEGGLAEGDVLISIEQVFGGTAADTLSALEAGSRISGAGGDDLIIGRSGNDILGGGNGNDTIMGSAGADLINGNRGFDLVDYSGSDAAVNVDLAASTASGGYAEGDLLKRITDLVGSAFDDSLTGDWQANRLSGGAGNDTLTGGERGDTFVFAAGGGNDVVTDFDAGEDSLFLVNTVTDFTDLASVQAAATETNGGLLIDTGGGNSVFLEGISLGDLSESNLVL